MRHVITHRLYIPGRRPRSFLSLHLAFEAAEESGAKRWAIVRRVLKW
jgi:hypothetical protein